MEAALIDCYAGLTNKQAGYESDIRGCRHAAEIIAEFNAVEFEVDEPLIAFTINQMWKELGVYEATRGVWHLNIQRARERHLVLGVVNNIVKRGSIAPANGCRAHRKIFPGTQTKPKTVGGSSVSKLAPMIKPST